MEGLEAALSGDSPSSGMLDIQLENVWRELVVDSSKIGGKEDDKWQLKKRLGEHRQAIAERKTSLLFMELSLEAGERVLNEASSSS